MKLNKWAAAGLIVLVLSAGFVLYLFSLISLAL